MKISLGNEQRRLSPFILDIHVRTVVEQELHDFIGPNAGSAVQCRFANFVRRVHIGTVFHHQPNGGK